MNVHIYRRVFGEPIIDSHDVKGGWHCCGPRRRTRPQRKYRSIAVDKRAVAPSVLLHHGESGSHTHCACPVGGDTTVEPVTETVS